MMRSLSIAAAVGPLLPALIMLSGFDVGILFVYLGLFALIAPALALVGLIFGPRKKLAAVCLAISTLGFMLSITLYWNGVSYAHRFKI